MQDRFAVAVMKDGLTIYLNRCPEFALFLSIEEEGLSAPLQEQEDTHQTCQRESLRCRVFCCYYYLVYCAEI